MCRNPILCAVYQYRQSWARIAMRSIQHVLWTVFVMSCRGRDEPATLIKIRCGLPTVGGKADRTASRVASKGRCRHRYDFAA